jgi:hypothetical protein
MARPFDDLRDTGGTGQSGQRKTALSSSEICGVFVMTNVSHKANGAKVNAENQAVSFRRRFTFRPTETLVLKKSFLWKVHQNLMSRGETLFDGLNIGQ